MMPVSENNAREQVGEKLGSSVRLVLCRSLAMAVLLSSCGSSGSTAGSGGESGTGGASANGSGGATGSGTGGATTGSGGAAAGSGGVASSGGATGTGGSVASGGALGTGSGGASGSGGAGGTGGATGTGGAAGGVAPGTGGGLGGGAAGAIGGGGVGNSGGSSSVGGKGGDTGAPGVRIVGRTAPGSMGGTRFEWSGSSVSARFMGTQVSAQLNDGNNGNSFEVVIDGANPKKIFSTNAQTLVLATGLAPGIHQLLFWRDTEANVGPTEFIGLTNFGMGGALLSPPPAPDRRIEIVGDSFSVGAGIEGGGAVPCSGNKVENDYLSYGAIAARSVGADLVTIAWSGIGVWRNYGTATPTPTTVMPARYDYAIPTDTTTTWDFSKYQPHVVVMNLTNNDFSVGDPGQPYVDAYLKLVKHIRSNYPNAYIMNTIQWATADTVINSMVATLKAGGDNNVGVFDLRPFANRKACDHPDMPASQAMGDSLATELRRVLGW
jgi:hypothetical protein